MTARVASLTDRDSKAILNGKKQVSLQKKIKKIKKQVSEVYFTIFY